MKQMKFIILGSALLICGGISAQNIKNTTVEVSRAYEGRLLDVHKPAQKMFVPDTLTDFALDFDYSVFENPYRGAYDFKPYFLDMKPAPDAYTGRKFYLKAGAGWLLRPTMDLVWEPQMKGRLRMSAYASHYSYFGDYRNIALDGSGQLGKTGGSWNGYDMKTVAGVSGRADFAKARLTFDVNYTGIHTKDSLTDAGYNAASAGIRVQSLRPMTEGISYDVAFKYRFSSQGLGDGYVTVWPGSEMNLDVNRLDMNDFDLSAVIGKGLGAYSSLRLSMDFGLSSYSTLFSSSAGTAMFTPQYLLERNRWRLSLGLGIGMKVNSSDSFCGLPLNSGKGQIVYPDVYVGYTAMKEYLHLYFSATSGIYRNPYSVQKERNHFYSPYFSGTLAPLADNTVECINAAFGLKGNICSRFRYDIKAGYVSYGNAPLDMLALVYETDASSSYRPAVTAYMPAVTYLEYDQAYVSLLAQWESESFALDAELRTCSSSVAREELLCFEPSAFTGDVNAAYNFRHRLFFRCTAEFASRRSGRLYDNTGSGANASKVYIPFWMDLGMEAEYVFTPKLSFWLRGDNLLNMSIQRTPFYGTGGIGATGGIRIVL